MIIRTYNRLYKRLERIAAPPRNAFVPRPVTCGHAGSLAPHTRHARPAVAAVAARRGSAQTLGVTGPPAPRYARNFKDLEVSKRELKLAWQ